MYQALIKREDLGLLGSFRVLQAVPLLELTLGASKCRPLTVLRDFQAKLLFIRLRVE